MRPTLERAKRGDDVYAKTGDRILIRHPQLGGSPRDGEILETRGPNGTPPYVVRWEDNGHEALVFPGPDAEIQHLGSATAPPR
jgi:hypothetical protein